MFMLVASNNPAIEVRPKTFNRKLPVNLRGVFYLFGLLSEGGCGIPFTMLSIIFCGGGGIGAGKPILP